MEKDFYYKKDKFGQLRGFCAVVQCDCSISKAAKKLCLEQPAISKQISALERDLGISLFDRNTKYKRLILTEDGKKFYEDSICIVQSVDGLYQNFAKNVENEKNNVLRIGGLNFILSDILPKYLCQLKAMDEFKDLIIEISDIPREIAFQRLIDKEIDIIFYFDKKISFNKKVEIERTMMVQDEVWLICRKNHPLTKIKNLTKKDVEQYPNLFLKSYSTYDVREIFNLTKKNYVFENLDWHLMKNYLLNSDNILLLTEKFCEKNIFNNDNYAAINIKKWASLCGIYYFSLKNSVEKRALKVLKEIILNDNSVK
ncbi:MAG: LysR family transcriptional regulator [Rickettsiales bacterium]|nr:LysR family transcriptional regulator [Rickettsiales bacterium]